MTFFRDAVERMTGYTPGEQPRGDAELVKLNTNENPYPPSPRVLRTLAETDWTVLRKYPDPLATPVRERVGALFGVRPEQVLCGNGSDELLTMALRAFVGEGEVVAYPTPTYSLYPVLAAIQGARTVEVPTGPAFETPLEALAETDARLLLLCNPNAPTGVWTDPKAIGRLADRFGGVVVVDEAYADFGPGSAVRALDGRPNVLVLRTLSKSYSLAGLRFGYVVGPEALVAGLRKVKDSYNCDAVSIAAAAAALDDEAWKDANVARVREERARLTGELEALGFEVTPSAANFVLARVPGGDGAAVYEGLKARGILVRYWNQPRLDDTVRITVGTPAENGRLLEALRTMSGRETTP